MSNCYLLLLVRLGQPSWLDAQVIKLTIHACGRGAVDFFDASGTLFAMANFLNNFVPGARIAQTLPVHAVRPAEL